MKKLLMVSVLTAGMFLASNGAFAMPPQERGFMSPTYKEGNFQEMREQRKAEMEKRKAEIDARLNVTDEQKEQLKTIHDKAKAEIAPKIKQLTEVEHELSVLNRQQMNKEKYDINTLEGVKLSGKNVEQLKSEQRTLQEEIRKIKKDQFEESQKVFTDEQKKELEKMRKEHEKTMKKNMKAGIGMDWKKPYGQRF